MAVTQFELSRQYWDFAYDNPELVTATHAALYFYAIEVCNRLGWKDKFGLPSENSMSALGIKNHHTYNRYFNDLVKWGFFKLIEKSKNQHSANIIAMPKNNTPLGIAPSKALDRTIISHDKNCHCTPHGTYHGTPHSTCHIDKPLTSNHKPQTITDSNESGEAKKNKKSKAEKETTPHWQILVDVWANFYEQKKGEKPTISGSALKDLKAILKNLENRSHARGKVWTHETAAATFTAFLEHAYKLDWIPNNFLLSNLNRQFDKIITSKNGTANSNSKTAGVEQYQRSLIEQVATIAGTGTNDTGGSSW